MYNKVKFNRLAFFMPLVIEDGTQVANANSYVSLADARTIAAQFGVVLDADDTTAENNLIIAYNWLNTLESEFQGRRLSDIETATTQTGVWPRSPVYIRDNLQDKNSIPNELIQSQVIASHANESGNILAPSIPSSTGSVIEETLEGVGSLKYDKGYTPTGNDANTWYNFAYNLLNPLFESAITGASGGLAVKKWYS